MVDCIAPFDFGLGLVGRLDSFNTKMIWAIGKDTRLAGCKKTTATTAKIFVI
jgi:hypothetical protein